VWQLLEHAIVYSDNEAAALLAAADGADSMETIRRPADFPAFQEGTLWLTPHHFTALFRIRYNASFLSVESSQRALELLARVDFRDGLIAGVPQGIRVANKFGERIDGDLALLHDCGIVYHPAPPYLLCVMTEGPAPRPPRSLHRRLVARSVRGPEPAAGDAGSAAAGCSLTV
jgi:hypothetical protein